MDDSVRRGNFISLDWQWYGVNRATQSPHGEGESATLR